MEQEDEDEPQGVRAICTSNCLFLMRCSCWTGNALAMRKVGGCEAPGMALMNSPITCMPSFSFSLPAGRSCTAGGMGCTRGPTGVGHTAASNQPAAPTDRTGCQPQRSQPRHRQKPAPAGLGGCIWRCRGRAPAVGRRRSNRPAGQQGLDSTGGSSGSRAVCRRADAAATRCGCALADQEGQLSADAGSSAAAAGLCSAAAAARGVRWPGPT